MIGFHVYGFHDFFFVHCLPCFSFISLSNIAIWTLLSGTNHIFFCCIVWLHCIFVVIILIVYSPLLLYRLKQSKRFRLNLWIYGNSPHVFRFHAREKKDTQVIVIALDLGIGWIVCNGIAAIHTTKKTSRKNCNCCCCCYYFYFHRHCCCCISVPLDFRRWH